MVTSFKHISCYAFGGFEEFGFKLFGTIFIYISVFCVLFGHNDSVDIGVQKHLLGFLGLEQETEQACAVDSSRRRNMLSRLEDSRSRRKLLASERMA